MEFTDSHFEEDDLNALDIPDMPPSSLSLTDEMILSGRSEYKLVKRPLPANFVVADALAPFETAGVEDQGFCESKYWLHGGLGKLYQNSRDSSDWDDYSNDPIFTSIPEESELISLEDLTSLYNPNHCDDGNEEVEEQLREATEEAKSPQDGEHTGDIMDSLDHALSEGRRKQTDSKNNTTNSSNESAMPHTEAEEILASLGVTGAPKPVRAPARPYPPPSVEEQKPASLEHRSWSNSRSPSRYGMPAVLELLTTRSASNPHHRHIAHDRRSRIKSGIKSEYHDRESSVTLKDMDGYNSRYPTHENRFTSRTMDSPNGRSYPQEFEPPLPLITPAQKPSYFEGVGIRPLSAGQNLGNHPLFADPSIENGTSYSRPSVDGLSSSSTQPRPERSIGRKRDYDHRDSSDESENCGRRQIDDVTPKLKRRQPKVAEAYR